MKLRALWVVTLSLALLGPGFVTTAQAEATPAAEKAAKKQKKQKLVLKLEELNSKSKPKEIKALRKSLRKIDGVLKVKAKRSKGRLVIRHRPDADLAAIRAAIGAAGFTIVQAGVATPATDPPAAEPVDESPAAGAPADDDLPEDF